MLYKEYSGFETCQVKMRQWSPNERCTEQAKFSITNGRLRCSEHFCKWLKNKLTKDIEKQKAKLIEKVKVSGLYENFGENEVRMLEDKYHYSTVKYGGYEDQRAIANLIAHFDYWCANFTDKDIHL